MSPNFEIQTPDSGIKRKNLRPKKYEDGGPKSEKPETLKGYIEVLQKRTAEDQAHHQSMQALYEKAAKESEERAELIRDRISRFKAGPDVIHAPLKKGERVAFGSEDIKKLEEFKHKKEIEDEKSRWEEALKQEKELEERKQRRFELKNKTKGILNKILRRGGDEPRASL